MPPNTVQVHSRSESVVGGRRDNHGCRVLENISLFSSPCLSCGVKLGGVAIYRVEVLPVSGCGIFPSFISGRTRQQHL
ncbi:hypothetical protein TNCV_2578621 [Trichonephila clavipes]|nr:hypothetical protein TNCV_2578621 [Trichonephila clavipes]